MVLNDDEPTARDWRSRSWGDILQTRPASEIRVHWEARKAHVSYRGMY
jgi:hypothetical protein